MDKHVDEKLDSLSDDANFCVPSAPTMTPEAERRLWRKVDLRLMPILALMYLLSFLDRGNIGNAKLQGLTSQLHLVGNQYNIALTMYFISSMVGSHIAYLNVQQTLSTFTVFILALEPSMTMLILAILRWLPGVTVAWGIVMTLMGLVKTYPQLVVCRVFLGIAEAGVFPGVVYYLTFWYPRYQLQLRIAFFFGSTSLAGAFSGLLAYGIGFMSGTQGLLGWSWIFILEGIATVAVGVLAFFILVDFPETASFLTPEERAFIVFKQKYDHSTVGEEEHFETRHLWAAVTDWQIWLHILIYMSVVAPFYGITLFLPLIINSFGHSPAISQLLTIPPYVFATICIYTFAYFSDKLKMRSPFLLLGLAMCLIGFAINISNVNYAVKYFGTFFCVAGSYAAFPGVVAWLGNNLSGQYKRGVGMGIHIGIGGFSGAIAANMYRPKDSPKYHLGHGLELMFIGIGFITVTIVVLSYIHINRKRDKLQANGEMDKYSDQQLREMGDKAPNFRYTL